MGVAFLRSSGVREMTLGVAEGPHQTVYFQHSIPCIQAAHHSEYAALLRGELNRILYDSRYSYDSVSCSNCADILTNLRGTVEGKDKDEDEGKDEGEGTPPDPPKGTNGAEVVEGGVQHRRPGLGSSVVDGADPSYPGFGAGTRPVLRAWAGAGAPVSVSVDAEHDPKTQLGPMPALLDGKRSRLEANL